jgi:hypothetical protein
LCILSYPILSLFSSASLNIRFKASVICSAVTFWTFPSSSVISLLILEFNSSLKGPISAVWIQFKAAKILGTVEFLNAWFLIESANTKRSCQFKSDCTIVSAINLVLILVLTKSSLTAPTKFDLLPNPSCKLSDKLLPLAL